MCRNKKSILPDRSVLKLDGIASLITYTRLTSFTALFDWVSILKIPKLVNNMYEFINTSLQSEKFSLIDYETSLCIFRPLLHFCLKPLQMGGDTLGCNPMPTSPS